MKKQYNHKISDKRVSFGFLESPIGLTGLAASKQGLLYLANKIPNENYFKNYLVRDLGFQASKNQNYFNLLIHQFEKYFDGNLKVFNFPLDMRLGTIFQQKVWKALLNIPYGKTKSYKWLAKFISNPKSARAVGNANGKNPLSIIVPCHRIIRENGDLGGYTGGVKIKRYLLKLENSS